LFPQCSSSECFTDSDQESGHVDPTDKQSHPRPEGMKSSNQM